MNGTRLEAFLARLYADREALNLFLRAPEDAMREAGLDEIECAAMRSADVVGLRMAARSYANKRAGRAGKHP
ncbi:MAG TPA: hypothetical protein VFV17_09300 [Usitatibacteraceae bacterium]|nr:hypothetical protein [Usitatibacteraceae bacterium]